MRRLQLAACLLAVPAIGITALLLTGCGGHAAARNPASPSPSDSAPAAGGGHLNGLQGTTDSPAPSPDQSPGTLPGLETLIRFTDSQYPDITLLVTVDQTLTPSAGVFGMHMKIENQGQASYDDNMYNGDGDDPLVVLYDTNSNSYSWHTDSLITRDANGNALPDVLGQVRIWPGGTAAGWVYFELDQSVTPSSVQFHPNNWNTLGEWRLN